MYCTNCGHKMKEDAAFCSNCGQKILADPVRTNGSGNAGSGRGINYGINDAPDLSKINTAKGKKPGGRRKKLVVVLGVIAAASFVIAAAAGVLLIRDRFMPGDSSVFRRQLELGQKYIAEENYDAAIIAFEKAIGIDPKNKQAYSLLADVYVRMDDYEKALDTIKRAEEAGVIDKEDELEGKKKSISILAENYSGSSTERGSETGLTDSEEGTEREAAGSGWQKEGGNWFFYGPDGKQQTGWITDGPDMFYCDGNGIMQTGWKEIDGKYYYFDEAGRRQHDMWIGDYYLGTDGAMLVNTTTPDGYQVDADGKVMLGEQISYKAFLERSLEQYIGKAPDDMYIADYDSDGSEEAFALTYNIHDHPAGWEASTSDFDVEGYYSDFSKGFHENPKTYYNFDATSFTFIEQ